MTQLIATDRYRPFLEQHPSLNLIGRTPMFQVDVPELPDNGADVYDAEELKRNLAPSVAAGDEA